MIICVPLLKRPSTVSSSNIEYYDGNSWIPLTINTWEYIGNELVINVAGTLPQNIGSYGVRGVITLAYSSSVSMGNPNTEE